jgi:chromosomal replication initiation ATPase DnaA
VVGDDAFIAGLSAPVEPPRQEEGLDEIIIKVAREEGVSLNSIHSSSRRRRHVLVRAMIAWRATQSGVATLAEVAARLGRPLPRERRPTRRAINEKAASM